MANRTIVASAPHVHGPLSTTRLMGDVIIALIPALAVSVYVYGWGVLAITAVSIGCCVLFEALIQKFLVRGKQTVTNLSAVVTGLLLAMNMPANIPLWIVAVGALIAIGVAKMPFGGLGKNPFNPAIVARVFLLIAYPVQMTSFALPSAEGFVDAYSGATPLAAAKAGLMNFAEYDALGMFAGNMAGSFGEIATLALLLGFAYLLVRRVITWHIPVSIFATVAVFAAIYGACSFDTPHLVSNFALFHLLSGGVVLGAVFMATDYVTSPMTTKGMVIYGIGIGALTMIIRLWGAYPEGMSFAILIMNAVVPLINKYIKPRRFGAKKYEDESMKSSLKNMVLVLFCITLISSACVGLVNMITVEPIAQAKAAAVQAALAEVLPEFDATTKSEHTADELQIIAYEATKDDEVVGYAIESATKNGFSGLVRLMVGFDTKGTILNVNVLEQAETPGLGAKMTEEGNPLLASIQGKEAPKTNLTVKKDGGDVDALTAATISSRAYAEAVARAYSVFKVVAGWEKEVQATSGASQTKKEE